MSLKSSTIGIIIGNRDFFPDKLVSEARKGLISFLKKQHITPILLKETDTKLGGVETFEDARKCAALFKKNADKIEGILVVLPNFGDERAVADTIRMAGLNVPVLVQAFPDELEKMNVTNRRDAWCGKISVCHNLYQYGIKYSLTTKHVTYLNDDTYIKDLNEFVSVCKVVNGLREVRIGAIGARPGAFNTVRYSEKILQKNGISVVTMDFSEVLSSAEKLKTNDKKVKEKLEEIYGYANPGKTPPDRMALIAKMGVVLSDIVEANALDATAILSWNSVQRNFGCNVCTNASMMSEAGVPSAPEVDVMGAFTMYAMQLASGTPSALDDWNNNYANEEDKVVLFHCGNWAKSFLPDITISTAPILGTQVGTENTFGALEGRTPAMPFTYGRVTTDDFKGTIRAYFGEGDLTNDKLKTFGTRAVAQVKDLNKLMQYICRNGFEHHVAMNGSKTAGVLKEAFENYLGWETYIHS